MFIHACWNYSFCHDVCTQFIYTCTMYSMLFLMCHMGPFTSEQNFFVKAQQHNGLNNFLEAKVRAECVDLLRQGSASIPLSCFLWGCNSFQKTLNNGEVWIGSSLPLPLSPSQWTCLLARLLPPQYSTSWPAQLVRQEQPARWTSRQQLLTSPARRQLQLIVQLVDSCSWPFSK